MAGSKGQKYNITQPKVEYLNRPKSRQRYFFVEGHLYKTLISDRANDVLRAWSYTDERVVQFSWVVVKKVMQQAFNTSEVAKLLNRSTRNLYLQIRNGTINAPVKIATKGENNILGILKWSEDDVIALHEHYLTAGSGRPRKDGYVRAAVRIPSRIELRAMLKENRVVYVKNNDGEYVPIFDQPDWT